MIPSLIFESLERALEGSMLSLVFSKDIYKHKLYINLTMPCRCFNFVILFSVNWIVELNFEDFEVFRAFL